MSLPRPTLMLLLAGTLALGLTLVSVTAAVSPQSSRPVAAFAYTSTSDGNAEVYVRYADDKSDGMRITRSSTPDVDPALSPDGSRVAFSSKRNGDFELYAQDLANLKASPVRLTRSTAADTNPAWSPDGRSIAYVSDVRVLTDIYAVPSTSSSTRVVPVQLTNAKGNDYDPAWSPDGRSIVFVSERDGNAEIYVMSRDGSNQRRLTSTKASERQPVWSPDGSQIAYLSNASRAINVYVMDRTGRGVRQLTSLKMSAYRPSWSLDGSQVFFSTASRSSVTIQSVDLISGKLTTRAQVTSSTPNAFAGMAVGNLGGVVSPPSTPTPAPTATPVPTATPTRTPTPIPTPTATAVLTPTPISGGYRFGPGQIVRTDGFTVAIQDIGAQTVDSAWSQVSGGTLEIEYTSSSFGDDQFQSLNAQSLYVADVELRGPMTAGDVSTLENGAGRFIVDIEGLPTASDNVRRVDSGAVEFDIHDSSLSSSLSYRTHVLGSAKAVDVTLSVVRGSQPSGLREWWTQVSHGAADPKQVTVNVLDRNGEVGRSWTYLDCSPVDYVSSAGLGEGVATETVTVRCQRIELSPGAGPRSAMLQWLAEAMSGQGERRDVTLTELRQDGSQGAQYVYSDALPVRYELPALAVDSDGLVEEVLVFKPERLEVVP